MCCGSGVGTATPASEIQEAERTTVGSVVVDVVLAEQSVAGVTDLRNIQASSWHDPGGGLLDASQITSPGMLVNDGAGTVAYAAAFTAPATFGPGVQPSPALVIVGNTLVARFTGVAGQTSFHRVVWEAYS